MNTSLHSKLQDVRKTLNNITNINYGGCGIAALAMYLYAEKNFGKKPLIFLTYENYSTGDFRRNKEFSKTNTGYVESPSHVVLKYSNKYFDTRGTMDVPKEPLKHKVSVDVLIHIIINAVWNPDFNRAYMQNIEKELNIKFPVGIN